jgi:hypothetical protein
VFPFFGRKHNPYKVLYKKDKILIKLTSHSKDVILDIATEETKNSSYLDRIASLDNRLFFEYTCRNLTELLNSKSCWGVDSTGKVFDLINTERYKTKLVKIRKVKKGLIWVNSVSYPILIDKTINLESADFEVLRILLLYIDNEWVLYKVTYDTEISEYISI